MQNSQTHILFVPLTCYILIIFLKTDHITSYIILTMMKEGPRSVYFLLNYTLNN